MRRHDYTVVISALSTADGGGYLASVPELPGCMSDGETREEAVAAIQDAIEAWIEEAERLGRPIPEPRPYEAA